MSEVKKNPFEDKSRSYVEIPQNDTKKVKKGCFRSIKGIIYGFIAATNFCIGNIILKKCRDFPNKISITDHLVIFYGLQLVLLICYACCKGRGLFANKEQLKILIPRSIVQTCALGLLYAGITLLPPSDVAAIAHTSIIFTAILSRFFLKERFGFPHLFAIVLTIFGVVYISKPSFLFKRKPKFSTLANYSYFINQTNQTNLTSDVHVDIDTDSLTTLIGIACTLVCSICWAFVRILTKKATNTEIHWSIINIFPSYVGMPICLIISIIFYSIGFSTLSFQGSGIKDLFVQIGLSVLSTFFKLVGVYFLTSSYRYEDATKISIAKTIDIVIAFILQSIILKVKIDTLSVIGSILILVGALIVLAYKIAEQKYKTKFEQIRDSSLCGKFFCLKF